MITNMNRHTAAGLNRPELYRRVLDLLPGWADESRVLLMGIRGSHAHGTYIPPEHDHGTDDVDVFVVTAQPVDWYLGLESYSPQRKHGYHFELTSGDLDVLVYDIRKFSYLLMRGNPNVHNWLWSPPDCYLHQASAVEELIGARQEFLSRRTLSSTAGYAAAQLHKMDHFQRQGYMGAKRKALVELHGYDVKNAAHCIRLLWQGIGIAASGKVTVRWRHTQAATLRAIKQGEMSLQEVRDLAEHYFEIFNNCRAFTARPEHPDESRCGGIVVRAIRAHEEYG